MSALNINDLAMVVKIIDLGSEKGIFKGPDLKTVGDLRERVVEFIKSVEEANQGNQNVSDKPQ